MNQRTEAEIMELLWESLKRVPGHPDRRQTGWGTKTKQGMIACITRIISEKTADTEVTA